MAPKINEGDNKKDLKVQASKSIRILCPAQAFPVPVFK